MWSLKKEVFSKKMFLKFLLKIFYRIAPAPDFFIIIIIWTKLKKIQHKHFWENFVTFFKTSCNGTHGNFWVLAILVVLTLVKEGRWLLWKLIVTSQQTFVGLQDVLKTCLEDISWRRLQDVSEANKIFTGDICI